MLIGTIEFWYANKCLQHSVVHIAWYCHISSWSLKHSQNVVHLFSSSMSVCSVFRQSNGKDNLHKLTNHLFQRFQRVCVLLPCTSIWGVTSLLILLLFFFFFLWTRQSTSCNWFMCTIKMCTHFKQLYFFISARVY